jgi:hypothetical protein
VNEFTLWVCVLRFNFLFALLLEFFLLKYTDDFIIDDIHSRSRNTKYTKIIHLYLHVKGFVTCAMDNRNN